MTIGIQNQLHNRSRRPPRLKNRALLKTSLRIEAHKGFTQQPTSERREHNAIVLLHKYVLLLRKLCCVYRHFRKEVGKDRKGRSIASQDRGARLSYLTRVGLYCCRFPHVGRSRPVWIVGNSVPISFISEFCSYVESGENLRTRIGNLQNGSIPSRIRILKIVVELDLECPLSRLILDPIRIRIFGTARASK